MAEQFNAEQYRQQMSGQVPPSVPQMQPQQQAPQPQPVAVNSAMPQPYQPQSQPQPYTAPPQQIAPQQHYAQPQVQNQAPQVAPQHVQPVHAHQPQVWVPPAQAQQQPQTLQPQMAPQMQQAQHMGQQQMPSPPVFVPPPSAVPAQQPQDMGKSSKFKLNLKRGTKLKMPKVKKTKAEKPAGDAEVEFKSKTSPATVFLFGMASGIVCFFVGSMLMSSLLSDNSAQDFRDIERQNARAQQPVLPTSSPEAKAVAEATTP